MYQGCESPALTLPNEDSAPLELALNSLTNWSFQAVT